MHGQFKSYLECLTAQSTVLKGLKRMISMGFVNLVCFSSKPIMKSKVDKNNLIQHAVDVF